MESTFTPEKTERYLNARSSKCSISFLAIPLIAMVGLLAFSLWELLYYYDISHSIPNDKQVEQNYMQAKKIEQQFIEPMPISRSGLVVKMRFADLPSQANVLEVKRAD